jgi:hypothetical protein
MAETRYQAGSTKQAVWETFSAKGSDAALKKGQSLRVSEARLNRWLARWQKRPAKHESPRKKVFDVGNPALLGSLTFQGPDVSEVDWDNGYTQFIANNMLLPADFFQTGSWQGISAFVVMDKNLAIGYFNSLAQAAKRAKPYNFRFIYEVKDGKATLIPRKQWEIEVEADKASRRRLSSKEINQIVGG